MCLSFYIIIVLLIINSQAEEEKECRINNYPGLCMNINDCLNNTEYFQNNNRTSPIIDITFRPKCGYLNNTNIPLICCPLMTELIKVPDMYHPVNNKKNKPFAKGLYKLPSNDECGLDTIRTLRIIGGRPAILGEFPWMVAIGRRSKRNKRLLRFFCGGTLITDLHVLTAAHCIKKNDVYFVKVGSIDLFSVNKQAEPKIIAVKKNILHENYVLGFYENDISILLLSTPARGHMIAPICLPVEERLRSQTFEGYYPIVTGWGSTKYKGESTSSLMEVMIPVVSNSQCKKAYLGKDNIDDNMICAGNTNGDSCQGDSGGSLIISQRRKDNKHQFFQIGIVSFGYKCAEKGYPGVYTRVTKYIDWIENNLVIN